MTTFDIDIEIDKLIDTFAEDLKTKLKKATVRSEKQTLKQYITSQKSTEEVIQKNVKKPTKNKKKQVKNKKTPPRREQEYRYSSCSESDSDYSN